ncbi:ABC transporter substrate-binding protein [Bradyrhizobium roseum]|uniref:ABC transporter substrate-binding protein n=1 Tax=Bradyrhizobium roseum TaxID=3056648 RepID=UPI0026022C17|nr:ABC transporter substrate-binding protein [Bradyrhizobium roseus]WKA32069.1 ABC transporter substrate-binding protein [Bradyrhizobium roseus]
MTLAAITVAAAQAPKIKLGFAKCAHCLPMSLTPGLAKGVEIEATGFNSGNDVLTALVSKSIDVAQVTYLHYVTALDKGFDVVAVSGQINGGSECISSNKLALPGDDWAAFKAVVAKAKAGGQPLKVAASRGNAQDIHMRGAFLKQGVDPNKDIQFVNIPNPADHFAALQREEIDMVCSVEPFASQIRLNGAGKHFVFPYDQAAGNLTNLIVTRSDVVASQRPGVQAVVGAVVALNEKLSADRGPWIDVINKLTGLDKAVATEALKNAAPDAAIHRSQTLAIAAMMRDLKYISKDVSAEVEKNMEYSFLEQATGKKKNDLGY